MAIGTVGIMLLAAPAASAHAVLQASTPTPGEVVLATSAISSVELRFDESVEVSLGAIQVVAADGARVDTASVRHPGSDGARVAVGLSGHLSPGSYLVLWRVVSADSHPVHGSFTFAVGHPGPVAAGPGPDVGRSLALALGVARFTGYVGLFLLVGTVAFFILCLPSGWTQRIGSRLLLLGLGLTAAATVVSFGLQAALDAGHGWDGVTDSATLRALADTRLGHAHLARLAVVGVFVLPLVRAGRPSRSEVVLLVIGMSALVLTVAVEGHSGRSAWSVGLDVAHLTAAATWVGGLVALSALVLPAHRRRQHDDVHRADDVSTDRPAVASPGVGGVALLQRSTTTRAPSWAPVRHFSTVALCCVILIVLTGVLQALRQVPEVGALTATTYGRLLLVKVGVVLVVLAAAGVSRDAVPSAIRRRDESPRADVFRSGRNCAAGRRARRHVRPGGHRPGRCGLPTHTGTHADGGPVSVELTAVPTGARTLDVHLSTFAADGLPVDVPSVTADAAPQSGDPGPVTVGLLPAGTGHFIAAHVLLPHVGMWTLTLHVRTGEFDSYATSTVVTIR